MPKSAKEIRMEKQVALMLLEKNTEGKTLLERFATASLSPEDLQKYNQENTFPRTKYQKKVPENEQYNSIELMECFVKVLSDCLSDQDLNQLIDQFKIQEMNKGQQMYRNSSLAKVLWRAEIERHQFKHSVSEQLLLSHLCNNDFPVKENEHISLKNIIDQWAGSDRYKQFLGFNLDVDDPILESVIPMLTENTPPQTVSLSDAVEKDWKGLEEELASLVANKKTSPKRNKNSLFSPISSISKDDLQTVVVNEPKNAAEVTKFFAVSESTSLINSVKKNNKQLSGLKEIITEHELRSINMLSAVEGIEHFFRTTQEISADYKKGLLSEKKFFQLQLAQLDVSKSSLQSQFERLIVANNKIIDKLKKEQPNNQEVQALENIQLPAPSVSYDNTRMRLRAYVDGQELWARNKAMNSSDLVTKENVKKEIKACVDLRTLLMKHERGFALTEKEINQLPELLEIVEFEDDVKDDFTAFVQQYSSSSARQQAAPEESPVSPQLGGG